jgi:threonine synthase
VRAIRESGGQAIAVTEEEILWGMKELAKEGIFSEPTGAVTIPALKRMIQAGTIKGEDTVVCIVTGSGFKDLHTVERQVVMPHLIPADISAVEEFAEKLTQ